MRVRKMVPSAKTGKHAQIEAVVMRLFSCSNLLLLGESKNQTEKCRQNERRTSRVVFKDMYPLSIERNTI